MRKFDYSKLKEKKWDAEILNYISEISEYKGRQELFLSQKPKVLDNLVELAIIQSTQSSNEIEGIRTTDSRIKDLVMKKVAPRNQYLSSRTTSGNAPCSLGSLSDFPNLSPRIRFSGPFAPLDKTGWQYLLPEFFLSGAKKVSSLAVSCFPVPALRPSPGAGNDKKTVQREKLFPKIASPVQKDMPC